MIAVFIIDPTKKVVEKWKSRPDTLICNPSIPKYYVCIKTVRNLFNLRFLVFQSP